MKSETAVYDLKSLKVKKMNTQKDFTKRARATVKALATSKQSIDPQKFEERIRAAMRETGLVVHHAQRMVEALTAAKDKVDPKTFDRMKIGVLKEAGEAVGQAKALVMALAAARTAMAAPIAEAKEEVNAMSAALASL